MATVEKNLQKFLSWCETLPKGTMLRIDKIANVITLRVAGRACEVTEQEMLTYRHALPSNLHFPWRE